MTVARIDQVIPTLASRDAIGGHVVQLRDLLREKGYQSDIYYGNASPDRLDYGLPVARLGDRSTKGRVLLYQLSIGSPVADVFRQCSERKLLIDLDGFSGTPDAATASRLADQKAGGGADLLFVGKVSPHKGQHDLVKALAAYRRLYDPDARLHLVGGAISDDYQRAVERFAGELDLADALDFAGSVTHEELIAYYAGCDAFVCLSNHEGFCVPLLEAMYHGLPIVAYTNTAVPETVQGAGLILPNKEPVRVAAAIDRVVRDPQLRSMLAQAASERVGTFALPRVRDGFASALEAACAA